MIAGRQQRFLSAAVLAAAVSFAAPVHGQDERFPAGPPDMFKPGSVFTYYENSTDPARIEGLNTALNMMTAQSAETAGMIALARDEIAAGVADSTPDELARSVAASIEGTFSILVQAGFVRAMARDNPSFGQMLETARMSVRVPGGKSLDAPVLLAAAFHSMSIVAAGEKLREGAEVHELAGRYALVPTGDCAVEAGPVDIVQQDFVVEASGAGKLALYGAIGADRAYLVANEDRFAVIRATGQGLPQIEVPDRPSDLFEARLDAPGQALTFRSIARETCSFVLTKAG